LYLSSASLESDAYTFGALIFFSTGAFSTLAFSFGSFLFVTTFSTTFLMVLFPDFIVLRVVEAGTFFCFKDNEAFAAGFT
jgi:hypothetical protein